MKLNRNESYSLFSSSFFLGSLLFRLLLYSWSVGIFLELFQSIHGDFGSGGDAGGEFIGSSGESNLAALAFPDTA